MATIMITGGAGGIGAELAQQLADRGDTPVIADIDGSRAEAVAERIGDASSVQLDVTSPEACDRAVKTVVERHGAIDGLACCAGILTDWKPAAEYPPEQFTSALEVNLNGSFFTSQAVGRTMIDAGNGGSIVLTSSGMAQRAVNMPNADGLIAGSPGYSASKAAVEAVTRELAVAWGPFGIRVNAVSPGLVETEMGREALENPEYVDYYRAHTAAGRHGQPKELASVFAFLLSDGAAYMTAAIVPVDGGFLAV